MRNYFLESVRNVGMFLLCAQAILQLRAGSSYEKYIRMLVSAMVLLQLISPVFRLFATGEFKLFESGIKTVELSMEEDEKANEKIADQIAGELLEAAWIRRTREEDKKEEEEEWEQKKDGWKAFFEEEERIRPVEEIRIRIQRQE